MADRFTHRRQTAKRVAPPAGDGGIAIGRVLAEVVKALRRDEQPPWVAELAREWPALVGAPVASHTRPGRLVSDELTVYVDNSGWLSELQRYAQQELLGNLQRRFGTAPIRRIRLQLDPGQ